MSGSESTMAGRAAAICKNDLATQLVVEFTSLQGIMGRHYALLSGEPEPVAQAIEEHYLPRFVGDRLPEGVEGTAVGLADRLDTLVGLFAVGIRPTGAADPWGLRRAALGVVQILVEKHISISLAQAISAASEQLPVTAEPAVLRDVEEFVVRRLEGICARRAIAMTSYSLSWRSRVMIPPLPGKPSTRSGPWLERSDWDTILDNYARCVRITRDLTTRHVVDPAAIDEPATRALYEAYLRVAADIRKAPIIETLLQGLADLAPLIAHFFEEVLVMAEDLSVRQNRLALLQSVGALADGIIDLSQMEGF